MDDSTSAVDLIESILELKGIKDVDKAYNSQEALQKIQSENYDVYIIDYHLPFMNGLELAKIVRKRGNEKIIIITGDRKLKTEEFIVFYKPFHVDDLCKYIFE